MVDGVYFRASRDDCWTSFNTGKNCGCLIDQALSDLIVFGWLHSLRYESIEEIVPIGSLTWLQIEHVNVTFETENFRYDTITRWWLWEIGEERSPAMFTQGIQATRMRTEMQWGKQSLETVVARYMCIGQYDFHVSFDARAQYFILDLQIIWLLSPREMVSWVGLFCDAWIPR